MWNLVLCPFLRYVALHTISTYAICVPQYFLNSVWWVQYSLSRKGTEERELSSHILNIILPWLVKPVKFNCFLSVSDAVQEAVKDNIWLCHIVITCKYLKEFTQLSNFFAYMQKLDRQTTKSKQKLFTSFITQYYLHYNWETPWKFSHVSIHLSSANHADWQRWHRIDKVKQILFWKEDIAGGKNCFLFLCSFIK